MGYIQVEGINIAAAVFDTNQLSVMRGGSLLLKQAVEDIPGWFAQLEPVTTGASSGIYRVEDNGALDGLVEEIGTRLSEDKNYRHLTFAVAATQEQNFSKAKEILRAKVRLLQLRQLSVAPDPEDEALHPQACAMEGIRRAHRIVPKPPKGYQDKKLSEACIARFEYGRDKRASLYKTELDSDEELPFSEAFEDIVSGADYGNLSNKLAVVYFDGNGFSNLQRKYVKSAADQIDFDNKIKTLRREFLRELIDQWKNPKENKIIRLETLLWGGDEMMFVAPAWRGLELVRLFYKTSAVWEYKGEKLTHAGGLVFCHYKTPIARMSELAKDLADDVKESDGGRDCNAFNYVVLESIDYPAEPLETFFKRRYGGLSMAWKPLSAPSPFGEKARVRVEKTEEREQLLKRKLSDALQELPRSQIFQLARLATQLEFTGKRGDACLQINGKLSDELKVFIEQTGRLQKLYSDKEHSFAKLPELLSHAAGLPAPDARTGCDLLNELLTLPEHKALHVSELKAEHIDAAGLTHAAWRWLHLAELWDYLAPQQSAAQGETP